MTNYTVKRYFDDLEIAIKEAKRRAKTHYCTFYLYQKEQGFYISKGGPYSNLKPIAKVLWNGTVERLDQEEATK